MLFKPKASGQAIAICKYATGEYANTYEYPWMQPSKICEYAGQHNFLKNAAYQDLLNPSQASQT